MINRTWNVRVQYTIDDCMTCDVRQGMTPEEMQTYLKAFANSPEIHILAVRLVRI